MKKIFLSLSVLALTFATYSCDTSKKQEKDTTDTETMTTEETSEVSIDSVTLGWTGYKTTEKKPVNGVFKKVAIGGTHTEATSPEAVLDGALVDVTVKSLFSGNEERDPKLIDIFFGTMENTSVITGTLHLKGAEKTLTIKMNDTMHEVPVTTTYKDNTYTITGDVDLATFNAMPAVEALGKACFDLHKGADGVSKTWAEAHFEGNVYFSADSFK